MHLKCFHSRLYVLDVVKYIDIQHFSVLMQTYIYNSIML